MTDVGSVSAVDPAFKPRSLAINRFTDLQYIKQGTCHISTVPQRCSGCYARLIPWELQTAVL